MKEVGRDGTLLDGEYHVPDVDVDAGYVIAEPTFFSPNNDEDLILFEPKMESGN